MLIYFPVTHSIQIHASCVFSPPRHNHFWLSAHDRYYLFLLFIYLGGLILEFSLLWLQVNHGHEFKKIHQLSLDFMYVLVYLYFYRAKDLWYFCTSFWQLFRQMVHQPRPTWFFYNTYICPRFIFACAYYFTLLMKPSFRSWIPKEKITIIRIRNVGT